MQPGTDVAAACLRVLCALGTSVLLVETEQLAAYEAQRWFVGHLATLRIQPERQRRVNACDQRFSYECYHFHLPTQKEAQHWTGQ